MKLSKSTKIDLDSYYDKGLSQTIIIKDYYKRIVEEINKMTWSKDMNGSYNKVPSWTKDIVACESANRFQQEKEVCKKSLENCPKELKNIIEEILNDERVTGDLSCVYSLRLDFIDVWDGVEDMGWHWDGPCQSEMISLMYFNDSNLDLDYGGSIETGIRKIPKGKSWATDYDEVESTGIFPPSGRTHIWINNLNPKFVHRTHKLANNNTPRITLTFGVSFCPR